MKKAVLYNTLGEEVNLLPLCDLLLEHRDLYEKLISWLTEETLTPIAVSTARIQRRLMVRYEKAEAVMEALLNSKAAVEAHAPSRIELCLDAKTGKMIGEDLRDFYESHRPTVVENYRNWLVERSPQNRDDGSDRDHPPKDLKTGKEDE